MHQWSTEGGEGAPQDDAERMIAEQIAEAQRLTREWDEAHPREP